MITIQQGGNMTMNKQQAGAFHTQVAIKQLDGQLLDDVNEAIDAVLVVGPIAYNDAITLFGTYMHLAYDAAKLTEICALNHDVFMQIAVHDSDADNDENTPLIALEAMTTYVVSLPKAIAITLMRHFVTIAPNGSY